jgi:hypothetical protein
MTSSPNPYAIYLASDGTISWTKQFSSDYSSVTLTKFDYSSSSNIIIGLDL